MSNHTEEKQAMTTYLASVASFVVISSTLCILANGALDFWFVFSSTLIGLVTYGGACALTTAFKTKTTNVLCYGAACAFVFVAFLVISCFSRLGELPALFFLFLAVWGLIPGVIGSLTARCLYPLGKEEKEEENAEEQN